MPIEQCTVDGVAGFRWGSQGTCYTGADARDKAMAQAVASGELESTKSALKFTVSELTATSDERREATGVLARSFDGRADSLDADGEAMLPGDVLDLARAYMLQGRVFEHDDQHDRSSDVASIVEVFFNDERIQSPHFPKDSAVVTLRYHDDREWLLVKSGKRTGFSFDADVSAVVMEFEMLVRPDQVVA